jgi:proline dehydrogenase
MGLDLGTDVCRAVLRPVLEAGRRHGIFVRVDMESSDYTQRTLEIVRGMLAEGFEVGPVIQSYLHRSKADVAALAAERIRVRVCKGAYAEPAEVAFHDRAVIGDSFVALCETLLDADAYPGVATHDPDMIERVKAHAREHGIAPDRYEFQMLYGIRRDLQRQLVADGYRMRVYVPYGTEWWPYFMRRLAERPANVLFLFRTMFGERRS